MKSISLVLLCATVLLGGCGVQLPKTEGTAEFYENGKPKQVNLFTTKAHTEFHSEVNPQTGGIVVDSARSDSPRGYEDYVQAQMMIELKRLEFYKAMADALIAAGKSAAPVPVP